MTSPPLSNVEPESVTGTIALGGDGALLGMEFIHRLDKLLLVGKIVALVDNSMLPLVVSQVG